MTNLAELAVRQLEKDHLLELQRLVSHPHVHMRLSRLQQDPACVASNTTCVRWLQRLPHCMQCAECQLQDKHLVELLQSWWDHISTVHA